MASKKRQSKDVPHVVKKNKAVLPRQERKQEELKEELAIEEEKPFELNDDDKYNIKQQCEHMQNAKILGSVNTFLVKYVVYYRKSWLFVLYNRESHRLMGFTDISYLTPAEKNLFRMFKNQIELKARRQASPPLPQVRPIVMIKQNPPPVDIPDDFEE